MPVFSFGENDVCRFSLLFLSNSDVYSLPQIDLPTNAKPERNNSLFVAEKVSRRFRIHIAFVSWTGLIKLCVGIL